MFCFLMYFTFPRIWFNQHNCLYGSRGVFCKACKRLKTWFHMANSFDFIFRMLYSAFFFSLPYKEFFGGVSGLTVEQFRKIDQPAYSEGRVYYPFNIWDSSICRFWYPPGSYNQIPEDMEGQFSYSLWSNLLFVHFYLSSNI